MPKIYPKKMKGKIINDIDYEKERANKRQKNFRSQLGVFLGGCIQSLIKNLEKRDENCQKKELMEQNESREF